MNELRLKDLGRWFSGGTPPKDRPELWTGEIPWLSAKDIDSTRLREPTAFISSAAASEYSKLVPPDALLLIVRGMALAHGLPVVRTRIVSAFNQDLRALVCAPGVDPRFVHYSLIGHRWMLDKHIDRAAHGTARVVESLYGARIPLPSEGEQRRVGSFLDREVERIDELTVSLQEADSLSSQWLISRIAEMLAVESGDVPFGRYATLHRGFDLPSQDRAEGEIEVIGSGGPAGLHDKAALAAPAVITGRYGSIGVVTWRGQPCWPLNTTLFVSDFKRNHPRFVYWALRSLPLRREAAKAAVPGLHRADVHRLKLGRFEDDEQVRIARVLDAKEKDFGRLKTEISRQLELIQAYRSSLITEAVRGELRVERLTEPRMAESLAAATEGEKPEVLA